MHEFWYWLTQRGCLILFLLANPELIHPPCLTCAVLPLKATQALGLCALPAMRISEKGKIAKVDKS